MGFYTALATAGASAVGTYMQGQAASDQAKQEAEQSRYNAAISEQDAIANDLKTRFDQVRSAQAGERAVGTMRAKLGTTGARLDTDAPLQVVAEQLFENELQTALIGAEGSTRSTQLRSQAANLRAGASIADQRADNLKTATLLNTGTSLLGNVGTMYDRGMFTSAAKTKPKMTWGAPSAGVTAPAQYSGSQAGRNTHLSHMPTPPLRQAGECA